MDQYSELKEKIKRIEEEDFEEVALELFRFQATYNKTYRTYLELLKIRPQSIGDLAAIPFLPILSFKAHQVKTGEWSSKAIFTSSGTTGQRPSSHHIRDLEWYRRVSFINFEKFYGLTSNYCILALLPSYLERSGSSLIYMVKNFLEESPFQEAGFFLSNVDELLKRIVICKQKAIPILLFGVSFALLDLAERFQPNLLGAIVMETGGMKGRRKEITRQELHRILNQAFGTNFIHSEYGMTELQSQAYSKGNGRFLPGPTMRIFTREINDPFSNFCWNRTGVLNIIDLANIDTCSFIETQDMGRVMKDGAFEVLGRLDGSERRGCNLMAL